MPKSFCSPCAHPGCRRYAKPGQKYCEQHAKSERKERAIHKGGTRTERGYSNKWLKASKVFLLKHPLCAACLRQGIITPATEVDHIIPHKGNKELFWDVNNWQALCHKCHARKTVLFDGGFGNAIRPLGGVKK